MNATAAADTHDPRQPPLALDPQFERRDQQRAASALGMWIFLGTEVMFFGALFFGYAICRLRFPDAFAAASRETDVVLGTVNTAVLLTSSAFVALAVHAAEARARRATVVLLLVAAALGAAFMGIKLVEYLHDYDRHLVPWLGFEFEPARRAGARVFFALYFAMTGLHLVHLLLGMGLVLMLAWSVHRAHRNALADHVEIVALYWHFVDIVWVFLYPSLYLISRA